MDYKEMRKNIETMANENYQDFIKALVSFEKGINDEKALDELYYGFMEDDTANLLSEDFDYMIDEMREEGRIIENTLSQEERDDLVNLVGNIASEIETVERENSNGQKFEVSNFSIVSKDDEGNKVYTNCSAYGDKSKDVKDLNKGDFVKVFGQIRTTVDDRGKEYTNVRILSSKLLKAKEHAKGQDRGKKSILGQIRGYQEEEKKNIRSQASQDKGTER